MSRSLLFAGEQSNHDADLFIAFLQDLTQDFATEERLREVAAHFETHPAPSTERTVQQGLESIKANVSLLSRDSQAIKNYLSSKA